MVIRQAWAWLVLTLTVVYVRIPLPFFGHWPIGCRHMVSVPDEQSRQSIDRWGNNNKSPNRNSGYV